MEDGMIGIDDRKHLFEFFRAKGHRNLVLRVADVLDLKEAEQRRLCELIYTSGQVEDPRHFLIERGAFFDGHLVIPFDQLDAAEVPLEKLLELQAIVYSYLNVRRGKGEPSRIDPCRCGGKGKGCKECGGTGTTRTYLEVSEAESRLGEMVLLEGGSER
jgi:hypothetical protein